MSGGMKEGEEGSCVDVDECESGAGRLLCGENAECRNLPGSHKCVCGSGYVKDPFQPSRCIGALSPVSWYVVS